MQRRKSYPLLDSGTDIESSRPIMPVGKIAAVGLPFDQFSIAEFIVKEHVNSWTGRLPITVQASCRKAVVKDGVSKATFGGLSNSAPLIHVIVEKGKGSCRDRRSQFSRHPIYFMVVNRGTPPAQLLEGNIKRMNLRSRHGL